MYIYKLEVENFRNYEKEIFEFSPQKNIIYGLNGQGKTNIIEAIYFFVNGKSYRTTRDTEVINFEKDYCKIKIYFNDGVRNNKGEILIKNKKIIALNDIPLSKLSEIIGFINIVIFTPDMLSIVKEGPGVRRQFLDILISQLKPIYFKTLLNYYKVLFNRNNILKRKNKAELSTLSVWNEKLAEYGTIIFKYRSDMIKKINEVIKNINFENVDEVLEIEYLPGIKNDYCDKKEFLKQLEKILPKELEKGLTLIGPQRDDFEIKMNGKSIKKYGSQGQIRTSILKLKLCECEIIKQSTGKNPILLLDDILSELDKKRKEFFVNNLKDMQIFITCTQKENDENAKYFHIEKGKLLKE